MTFASHDEQHTNQGNTICMPDNKPLDKKTQKKINKTKADLARTQKTLDKKQAEHDKELGRFEKKLQH